MFFFFQSTRRTLFGAEGLIHNIRIYINQRWNGEKMMIFRNYTIQKFANRSTLAHKIELNPFRKEGRLFTFREIRN